MKVFGVMLQFFVEEYFLLTLLFLVGDFTVKPLVNFLVLRCVAFRIIAGFLRVANFFVPVLVAFGLFTDKLCDFWDLLAVAVFSCGVVVRGSEFVFVLKKVIIKNTNAQ